MPYVKGSGWDVASENLAVGFARGQQVGLEKQAQAMQMARDVQSAKIQDAGVKLAEQEAIRRAADDAIQAQEATARERSRGLVDQARQRQLDAQEELDSRMLGLSRAEVKGHRRISEQVLQLHPEMGDKVKTLWKVAMALPDPESRAMWLKDNAPQLVQEADDLARQKVAQRAGADYAKGRMASAVGATPELDMKFKMLNDSLDQKRISSVEYMKGVDALKVEAAKEDAEQFDLDRNVAYFKENFLSKFPPGSPMYAQAEGLVGAYNRKAQGVTFDRVQSTLTKMLQPPNDTGGSPQDAMLKIFHGLPAADDMGKPIPTERRIAEARKIYAAFSRDGEQDGPHPPQVDLTPDQINIVKRVRAENPEATDEEISAAIAAAESGDDGNGTEMRAPTSTKSNLGKPNMSAAEIEAFNRKISALQAELNGRKPGIGANKRGDGIRNR